LHAASVVQFSATTYNATEGALPLALVVQRSGDPNTVVNVDLATSDLTASAGADYLNVSTNLTFLAGETNKLVVVPILNDGFIEQVESFRATLENPSGGAELGTRTNATVRIADNDQGFQLELRNYSANEDAGTITVRVVRLDDGEKPVSVEFTTAPRTALAGEDYLEASGTLSFEPGQVVKYLTLTVLNDAIPEPSETFLINLRNPSEGATIGANPSATVTIRDTDQMVQFQQATLSVREDAAFARISVERGESDTAGTVDVATTNMTAMADQDYAGQTQTLQFGPGERLKFVDVPVLEDGVKEPSERFRLVLTNPTGGASLGASATRTVTVTILDNDSGIGFESANHSAWFKQGRLELNVVRGSDEWMGPFSVDYETVDGTARSGIDYERTTGTLMFGPNEMVKSIALTLLPASPTDTMRSLTVRLSNPAGPIALGTSSTRVTLGHVIQASPPLSGGIRHDGNLIHLSWPGGAALLRAASITGPWEQLANSDAPYLTTDQLFSGFYQFRSPRPARVYVSSSYDGKSPLPLMMVLHGYSVDAAFMLEVLRIEPLAEARGFLVCHPDGTFDQANLRFWNATEACCDVDGTNVDDSAYLRGLI
jgi:hypothetical protein